VPYLLNWNLEKEQQPIIQKQLFVNLNEDEKVVYDYLKLNDRELLDILAINCKLPTHKMAGLLLNMELKGVIKPLPGKLFELA